MPYDEESELTRYVWRHLTNYLTPHERLVGAAIDQRRDFETANASSSPRKQSFADWAWSGAKPVVPEANLPAPVETPATPVDAHLQSTKTTASTPSTYVSTVAADDALRRRAALRILTAHAAEIQVPRCPRCVRVLTNHDVPACFWCGLDWHDGRPLPKPRR
ncbi:MAG: hypothetical protein QM811_26470 [Pirellulales bacterium]